MAETCIPIFCTAHISAEKLNQFFQEANAATERCEFEQPMGFLMTSTTIPEDVDHRITQPPVDQHGLNENPFKGMSVDSIIDWAQIHLQHGGLSTENMVILDSRTMQDDTCILITRKELPENDLDKWIIIRSDFESSIITLMVKETAVGGDDHFETNYEGSDGVLRISIKHRAEARQWNATLAS